MLKVESIGKSYGSAKILTDLSFEVQPGQIAAIVGKNGCGKSTLLSIIAGLLRPDSGRVLLGGEDLSAKPRLRAKVGYVAQGDCLFEELSVGENLRFWASASGLPGGEAANNPFVKLLELGGFWKKRVRDLSGGMRRRVAICAALLSDPAYILLDEPFSGLDLIYRQELTAFLLEMKGMGKTLLFTTHSPEELTALSDTALLLSGGQITHTEDTHRLSDIHADLQSVFLSYLKGEHN
ncbi:MAG: ABC transporter ATP-binding protein [Oscillospiraceae bacterium]|nr:ABC transporter ATP-binding protein [Oscillospiraceae bacterium]